MSKPNTPNETNTRNKSSQEILRTPERSRVAAGESSKPETKKAPERSRVSPGESSPEIPEELKKLMESQQKQGAAFDDDFGSDNRSEITSNVPEEEDRPTEYKSHIEDYGSEGSVSNFQKNEGEGGGRGGYGGGGYGGGGYEGGPEGYHEGGQGGYSGGHGGYNGPEDYHGGDGGYSGGYGNEGYYPHDGYQGMAHDHAGDYGYPYSNEPHHYYADGDDNSGRSYGGDHGNYTDGQHHDYEPNHANGMHDGMLDQDPNNHGNEPVPRWTTPTFTSKVENPLGRGNIDDIVKPSSLDSALFGELNEEAAFETNIAGAIDHSQSPVGLSIGSLDPQFETVKIGEVVAGETYGATNSKIGGLFRNNSGDGPAAGEVEMNRG